MPTQSDIPPLLATFPVSVLVKRFGPDRIRPTDMQRRAYRRFTQVGDPLADDVVEMIRRMPTGEGRRLFDTALERGIDHVPDAPVELRALFAQVDSRPPWFEQETLERATQVAGRIGVLPGFMALSMLSLMGGYLAFRPDKPLVATGNLEYMTSRRLAETAGWVTDISLRGALNRDALGFKSVVRVRLMHAMVRAAMNSRDDWDYENWDHPINQSQTVGTLLLFSLGVLSGSELLGVRLTRTEREAVIGFWRYVGYLLGIDPELLPATEREAWLLMWLEAEYEFYSDDDTRKLADALSRAVGPMVVGARPGVPFDLARRAVTGYLLAFSRLALGKRNAEVLGLPNQPLFAAAVIASAAVNFGLEQAKAVVPGARWVDRRIGQQNIRLMSTYLGQMRRGRSRDRSYARHDSMH